MSRKPIKTARRKPPQAIHAPPRVERIIDAGIAEIVQQISQERRR